LNSINKKDKQRVTILIIIVILSFLLRIAGNNFGLPLWVHPDEDVVLLPAVHMAENATLIPDEYRRPNHISIFLNFFVDNIVSLVFYKCRAHIVFQSHLSLFIIIGRTISAIIGTLCVVVAYFIGREFLPDFSIPAALCFAFFPPFVEHSHYITPEIVNLFFTLLLILFSIRYIKRNDQRLPYFVILLSALNTLEKYPGLISFVFPVLCIAIVEFKNRNNHTGMKKILQRLFIKWIQSFLLFLFFMYIISPSIFLNFRRTFKAFVSESGAHMGMPILGWFGNIKYYVSMYQQFAGFVCLIFLFAGLFFIIKNRNAEFTFMFYGALYCLLLSVVILHWERWAVPMYTTPLLISSLGIAYVYEYFKHINKYLKYVAIFLTSLLLAAFISQSLYSDAKLRAPHTNMLALTYCKEHGITENNSMYSGYTPFRPDSPLPLWVDYDRFYSTPQYQYLMISSGVYQRFYNNKKLYHKEIASYDKIRSTLRYIKKIEPRIPLSSLYKGRIAELRIPFYINSFIKMILERTMYCVGPTIEIYEK